MTATWLEGWGSDFGGDPGNADLQIPGMDRMLIAIRLVIATAMDMDPKTVRPGSQAGPAGRIDNDFATVNVLSVDDASWAESSISGPDGGTTETVTVMQYVTVSVNFFRSKNQKTDDAGRPRFTMGAFDRACRLPKRLQFVTISEMMRPLGLGFIGASRARNLAGLADSNWESRGQVDVTFSTIAQESLSVSTFGQVGSISNTVEDPSGNHHTVSTP